MVTSSLAHLSAKLQRFTCFAALAFLSLTTTATTTFTVSATESTALTTSHNNVVSDYMNPRHRVSIFGAQWWEVNLRKIPIKTIRGDIDLRESYFISGHYGYRMTRPFILPIFGRDKGIPLAGVEFDSQVIYHDDIGQDVWETSAGIGLRTADLKIGKFRTNFLAIEGASYTFGRLALEKGNAGRRGVGQIKLLNHLALELEFSTC